MKKIICFVSLAVFSLFAGVSCQREDDFLPGPSEGEEELVLRLSEASPLRLETRSYASDEGDMVFSVETQEIPFDSLCASTRAITEVTSIGNGRVVWAARVGTNPVSFWNPVRVAASDNEVRTGHYVGTTGGTTNTYYICNSPSASNLSVTASGASLTVSNTGPAFGTDIVVGKAVSDGHEVDVRLDHIYARTGSVTLNVPEGLTVTNITWNIGSHDATTGFKGTYDIDGGTWTPDGNLTSRQFTGNSNYYLIPGLYDISLSYSVKVEGGTSQSVTRNGTVNLERGKVNNLSASVPDIVEKDLYVAWASADGIGGTYQEVPAHGDIYIGGHGTLEARLYTIRNGRFESYTVIPNAQVTWSIPYDSSYLSIDGSTGVLTGLKANTYSADYGTSSCYVRASATVDGVTYNATGVAKEARVNVVNDEVSSYGIPVLQLVYDPNPIVASGGTSAPTLTYMQVVTYTSGRTETITGTITSGATWSGSASGFSLDGTNGLVTAGENMSAATYTYGTPEVTLSYSGNPIAAAGGVATPVLSYSQSVRERREASSQRGITVSVTASVNGMAGTASCVVNQSGAQAVDNTTYLTEGGTVSWSMDAATGFSLNTVNGNVTASQNNTASIRSTYAWATVSMNGKSASSSHVLISQEAGSVTEYRYRFVVLPDGHRLGVGATRSFYVHRFTDTYVNGSLVEQGTVPTLMSNSDFTWSKVAGTSCITLGSEGSVTGVSVGTAVVRATLKSSVSEYSLYTNKTDDATVYVISGSWNDDWTDPGSGTDIPLN